MSLLLSYSPVWDETLSKDETTEYDSYETFDLDGHGYQIIDFLIGTHSKQFDTTIGTQTSEIYDISTVGSAKGSIIFWKENIPTGTSITVETNFSPDGGTTWNGWKTVINNSPIPEIPNNATTDISNARLQIRETLSTTDNAVSPELLEIDFFIEDVNSNNVRDTWQLDTRLLSDFVENSLEGGNVTNSGVTISQFAIKRRKTSELSPVTLAHVDFVNDTLIDYTDLTQANDEYIYSIVPVGSNGLEGNPISTTIDSDFVGWWIVDKDSSSTLQFDKNTGSQNQVSTQLNQGRVQIETLSKYPTIFYDPRSYTLFTLQATFLPEDWKHTGLRYQSILDTFVNSHNPVLIKADDGRVFVCDIYSPQTTTPQTTWNGYDYFTLSINAVEVDDYLNYVAE